MHNRKKMEQTMCIPPVEVFPVEDAVTLCPVLARNIEFFKSRLGAPANADVLIRRFQSGAFESALIAIDGLVN